MRDFCVRLGKSGGLAIEVVDWTYRVVVPIPGLGVAISISKRLLSLIEVEAFLQGLVCGAELLFCAGRAFYPLDAKDGDLADMLKTLRTSEQDFEESDLYHICTAKG